MKLIALIKKEFHRFFHDPRLIMTLLLPGVLIFILYSALGNIVNSETTPSYDYKVYVSGESVITAQIEAALKQDGSTFEWLKVSSPEEAISAVESGEASGYIAFSEGFDSFSEGAVVEIYYNNEGDGNMFFAVGSSVLQMYGMKFTVIPHSFFNEADIGFMVMQSILPMLMVAFIFSACMSVTLESVAGEKERGTLGTILATSVKRSHIALGKVIPLSCIAALGAASSFLGVIFSFPSLMDIDLAVFFSGYSILSYLLLFLLIVGMVPLIVSAISTISAYSKSVKEASGYTSIVMIMMIVLTLVTSFVSEIGNWVTLIPVLNVVMVMQEVLAGGMPVLNAFLTLGVNLVYTALLVLLISKMLSSEKMMFGK